MDSMQEQFVVDAEGNKTAVILPVERCERLIEALHDLAVVAERRDEKPITLKEGEIAAQGRWHPLASSSNRLWR